MAERDADLVLVTRRDCSLCDEFHAALLAWCAAHEGVAFETVDVDSSPSLSASYGWSVPVLLRGTELLMSGHFDAARLGATLA